MTICGNGSERRDFPEEEVVEADEEFFPQELHHPPPPQELHPELPQLQALHHDFGTYPVFTMTSDLSTRKEGSDFFHTETCTENVPTGYTSVGGLQVFVAISVSIQKSHSHKKSPERSVLSPLSERAKLTLHSVLLVSHS